MDAQSASRAAIRLSRMTCRRLSSALPRRARSAARSVSSGTPIVSVVTGCALAAGTRAVAGGLPATADATAYASGDLIFWIATSAELDGNASTARAPARRK